MYIIIAICTASVTWHQIEWSKKIVSLSYKLTSRMGWQLQYRKPIHLWFVNEIYVLMLIDCVCILKTSVRCIYCWIVQDRIVDVYADYRDLVTLMGKASQSGPDVVFESPVWSRSLASKALDRDRDRSSKLPNCRKTKPDLCRPVFSVFLRLQDRSWPVQIVTGSPQVQTGWDWSHTTRFVCKNIYIYICI